MRTSLAVLYQIFVSPAQIRAYLVVMHLYRPTCSKFGEEFPSQNSIANRTSRACATRIFAQSASAKALVVPTYSPSAGVCSLQTSPWTQREAQRPPKPCIGCFGSADSPRA